MNPTTQAARETASRRLAELRSFLLVDGRNLDRVEVRELFELHGQLLSFELEQQTRCHAIIRQLLTGFEAGKTYSDAVLAECRRMRILSEKGQPLHRGVIAAIAAKLTTATATFCAAIERLVSSPGVQPPPRRESQPAAMLRSLVEGLEAITEHRADGPEKVAAQVALRRVRELVVAELGLPDMAPKAEPSPPAPKASTLSPTALGILSNGMPRHWHVGSNGATVADGYSSEACAGWCPACTLRRELGLEPGASDEQVREFLARVN